MSLLFKTGERRQLNVTQEASHRIFVGLGWDPNETPDLSDTIGAVLGTRKKHHDLDLTCYYFDEDGRYQGHVVGEHPYLSSPSGAIYHSGDNVEGIGDGDDEQISVELKNLPEDTHHLFFKASIKSGHAFSDIHEPSIRICDGYTERCFLESPLKEADSNKDAYVFAHVYRGENVWTLHFIDAFFQSSAVKNWDDVLKDYIFEPQAND